MSNEWNQRQLYQVGLIYDMLAKLLPVEGRDYRIFFDFNGTDGKPHIRMTGLTPFGKQWVDYCMTALSVLSVPRDTPEPQPTRTVI